MSPEDEKQVAIYQLVLDIALQLMQLDGGPKNLQQAVTQVETARRTINVKG